LINQLIGIDDYVCLLCMQISREYNMECFLQEKPVLNVAVQYQFEPYDGDEVWHVEHCTSLISCTLYRYHSPANSGICLSD